MSDFFFIFTVAKKYGKKNYLFIGAYKIGGHKSLASMMSFQPVLALISITVWPLATLWPLVTISIPIDLWLIGDLWPWSVFDLYVSIHSVCFVTVTFITRLLGVIFRVIFNVIIFCVRVCSTWRKTRDFLNTETIMDISWDLGTFPPPLTRSSNAHAQPSSGARCLIFGHTLRLLPYFIMCANSKGSGSILFSM